MIFFSGICATCQKTLRALFIDEKEAATVTSPSVAMKAVNVVEEMVNPTLVGFKHISFINTCSQHANGINVNSSVNFETWIQICVQ